VGLHHEEVQEEEEEEAEEGDEVMVEEAVDEEEARRDEESVLNPFAVNSYADSLALTRWSRPGRAPGHKLTAVEAPTAVIRLAIQTGERCR